MIETTRLFVKRFYRHTSLENIFLPVLPKYIGVLTIPYQSSHRADSDMPHCLELIGVPRHPLRLDVSPPYPLIPHFFCHLFQFQALLLKFQASGYYSSSSAPRQGFP